MLAIGAVVVAPIVLSTLGLGGVAGALIAVCCGGPSLLVLVIVGLAAAYRYLPCRREPRWEWLSGRQRRGRGRVARQLAAVLLVHRQFRQLQRDLRLARRGGRHDDVDVDLDARRPDRRAAERRNRAPDRARLDDRGREKPLGQRGAVKADSIGPAQD